MREGITVFVGYDAREHAAWLVCRDSILRMTPDATVVPLKHKTLRAQGLFDRPWQVDEKGQTWDVRDGRPFSVEFSHSRFLTPYLGQQTKSRWAVFVDCDFLFLNSLDLMIASLDTLREGGRPLYVVKHEFPQAPDALKMDGVIQSAYPRKLWSSLMLWDLTHPATKGLTPVMANHLSGAELHRFSWLEDHEIGTIDESWNWVPGKSPPEILPDAVHWSLGGPWMAGYETAPYAQAWRTVYADGVSERLARGREKELYEC